MRYKERFIFFLGIFSIAVIIFIVVANISIKILYPINIISESLKENFKDSFGKSIKFDRLLFRYNGDIVLYNFYLSNSTDFNDNINLIHCRYVVINTSLIDLLRKKVVFSGIEMYKPTIFLIKNYGKSYYETFVADLIEGTKNEKIRDSLSDDFITEIKNAKIYYREIFSKGKGFIELDDVNVTINYNRQRIAYDIEGDIENKKFSFFSQSYILAHGKIDVKNNSSSNELKFKNIDISYFNKILEEKYTDPLLFEGKISGKIQFWGNEKGISARTNVELQNVSASFFNNSSHKIIKKYSASIFGDLYFDRDLSQIIAKSINIDDDITNLKFSFSYKENERIKFDITSREIDLEDLSYVFSPLPTSTYDGKIKIDCKIDYDFILKNFDELNLKTIVKNFNLTPLRTEDFKGISNCNIAIDCQKTAIKIETSFQNGKNDISAELNSVVKNWNPFMSETTVNLNSKHVGIDIIFKGLISILNVVYNAAYADMFQNFDEQRNFLKEPEGVFINNNDFAINIKADTVGVLENSFLNDFKVALILKKGTLKTEYFSLNGYDGLYSFDVYAAFHQEYPFIKLEGGVKDFNLTKLYADSNMADKCAGILSIDYKFETNAFRVGQIIENGRGTINLSVKNGVLSKFKILKNLNQLLSDNGYIERLQDPLTFNNFTITLQQSANEFYIRNFALSGDNCAFSAYGKYSEDEGLDVPFNLNIKSENSYSRIPFRIIGNLTSPCIKIDTKKSQGFLCFN